MRSCDAAIFLLISLFFLFLESQTVVAKPLRTYQQLNDELQEYIDKSDMQDGETSNSRSSRQSWSYYPSHGKKSEAMSANELLNQLYNIVRARGDSSGKIKAVRFGISKR